LYADDTFLILDGSENSLTEALECFESFYKVSGLKMNSSKTKAVWVGNKKYSDQIICPNMKLLPSRIRKVSSAYKLMRDSTSLIIIP
jgi:hypothetical protein